MRRELPEINRSQLPKTSTKTPMPEVKEPKVESSLPEINEIPDPPEMNEPLKENTELTIQIAKGPVLPGSEICICSIHNNVLQIYENYFRLKAKRKKGTWVLKKMGHLSELGKK